MSWVNTPGVFIRLLTMLGLLVVVIACGATRVYDGRVEKEVIAGATTVTKYVYANEDILLELNGANVITARYTHGPGIDEPLILEKDS